MLKANVALKLHDSNIPKSRKATRKAATQFLRHKISPRTSICSSLLRNCSLISQLSLMRVIGVKQEILYSNLTF